MTDFHIDILGTGSTQGNCVLVDNCIMLDAGLTKKRLTGNPNHEDPKHRGFGLDLSTIELVFVSHHHADHKSLPVLKTLIRQGTLAFIPSSVCDELYQQGLDYRDYPNVHYHGVNTIHTVTIGDTTYTFEFLPQKHHTIVNYAVVLTARGKRLLYATDLDTLGPTDVGPGLIGLEPFDTILLEGNYDRAWLREFIETTVVAVTGDDFDDDIDQWTDEDLSKWTRANYTNLPKQVAQDLFRACENLRHLSKQDARLYVKNHLKPGGRYYEIHRSSKFYEKPTEWSKTNHFNIINESDN